MRRTFKRESHSRGVGFTTSGSAVRRARAQARRKGNKISVKRGWLVTVTGK